MPAITAIVAILEVSPLVVAVGMLAAYARDELRRSRRK